MASCPRATKWMALPAGNAVHFAAARETVDICTRLSRRASSSENYGFHERDGSEACDPCERGLSHPLCLTPKEADLFCAKLGQALKWYHL